MAYPPDKPVPVFGQPYSTTTSLGEPMPVRCGYRKCGILFMTYEPRRKYCCTKHKNAQGALLKRENEEQNGALQAAIQPMTGAQLDMMRRVEMAKHHTDELQTAQGQKDSFDLSVEMALKWVMDGQNALGPFTLEHIKDERVRQAVNKRLANSSPQSPIVQDAQTLAIREALNMGPSKEVLDPISTADAPAIEYKEPKKTDAEKARDL